jgi:hypothetical protein
MKKNMYSHVRPDFSDFFYYSEKPDLDPGSKVPDP